MVLFSVAVPIVDQYAAAAAGGRVARQGGVGQRRRAVVEDAAAAARWPSCPTGWSCVSVAVPKLSMPPPPLLAELPDRVELVRVSVAVPR